MGVSFFLARRLSLSSQGHRSSPAVRVAVTAVALSVIVMMGAIAIVMGFKDEITRKVSGFNSHILLTLHQSAPDPESISDDDYSESDRSTILTLTPTLNKIILSSPGVTDVAVQASIPAILKPAGDFKGVYLKSLEGESLKDFISSSLLKGSLPDYSSSESDNLIVISSKVADALSLSAGDSVDTYFITDKLRVRKLKIAGVFDSHFEAYDDSFIYGSLRLIQNLAALTPGQGTSLAVSVADLSRVDQTADLLTDNLISAYQQGMIYRLYRAESVTQTGAAYFQWLSMLDMNVVVVLVLMTIVACVTLCSGMLILMMDKVRFIALMQALGASRALIGRIFLLLSVRIALIGLAIGDIIGIGILYLQQRFHFMHLDAESYYIDFVPVKLSAPPILILNASVIGIILCVLWLPSRLSQKKVPARLLAGE
ncbi:MAG: ABC transporter permease [Muribaculaceae bacterium]|nr:ABC transporter permease [Muribaculaceae bacterium]